LTEHTTTECLLFPDIFERPVIAKFDQRQGSSDGGAILLKAADRRLGLTSALAACLREERQPGKILHEMEELLTQRVMGMALGYEDANDAARLACDPVHKLLVGRDPIDGEDLASQPTLSRFENAPDRQELLRMSEALADCVIARHRKRLHGRARRITIDLDPTDDPTHGQQQFTFFNSHYDSYCYLPMVAFSPSTTRRNSIWLPPCCARVMFPAPAVRSAFCAACFGVWIPRFPERSSACAWMGGLRRRRFWSF